MDTTPYQIAKKVREQCEQWNEDNEGYFYSGLSGMCAIASVALTKTFHEHGFKDAVFIEGEYIEGKFVHRVKNYLYGLGHCWVELNDKIYDITATQFNNIKKEILVVEASNKRYINRTKRDVYRHRFHGWPVDQKPIQNKIKAILK